MKQERRTSRRKKGDNEKGIEFRSSGCLSGTYGVVSLNERVVDSDDLDVGVLDSVAEDDAANATEAVDANLDGSHCE
jgi:hypothetical protein